MAKFFSKMGKVLESFADILVGRNVKKNRKQKKILKFVF